MSTQKPEGATREPYIATPGPALNNGLVGAVTGGAGGPLSEGLWDGALPVPGLSLTFTTGKFTQTVDACRGSELSACGYRRRFPRPMYKMTLSGVRPDGYELYLQRGWLSLEQRALDPDLSTPLRPVHRQSLESLQPLLPGVAVLARVEINKFTHMFRPGSALRLTIDAPSPTGDWGFAGVPGGLNTVWCGGDEASELLVGLLSTYPRPIAFPGPKHAHWTALSPQPSGGA